MPENHNKDNHQFSQNRNSQLNKSQTFQKENKISDKEVQVEMMSEIASTSNFELSKPFSAIKISERNNKDKQQFSQNQFLSMIKVKYFKRKRNIRKGVQVEMMSEIASTSNFELSKPFSTINISESNNKDNQQFSQNPNPQLNKSLTFQKEKEISEKEAQVEMVSEVVGNSTLNMANTILLSSAVNNSLLRTREICKKPVWAKFRNQKIGASNKKNSVI
ncbi:hypothetical protein CEXT_504911 [Caerostris extrusa]|uniref:Uncharacterized protein n=1 Tax=Caerostris extrusa TaxID=172846 RepID=A0AAV4PIN7_CAEEX|nr:hypothetical protein CEXT_504911 [Caerostris extrusa]